MPTYEFQNKRSKKVVELYMTISECDQYRKDHPEMEQIFTQMNIVSGVAGARRIDNGFKDVLKKIKSHHRGSTINTEGL